MEELRACKHFPQGKHEQAPKELQCDQIMGIPW